ncbi:MAG: lytic transglycosylase domain-containing protein [Zoogloeaceae bacterium]|nr:lytic transglycosylase domain-containing protein [Zoogloeaceae bacterium]
MPKSFAAPSGVDLVAGDAIFLAGREAFRQGRRAQLEAARRELAATEHPLLPYLDYYLLRQGLDGRDAISIKTFLAREEGNYLGERLAADWLKSLAARQRWADASALYGRLKNPDQEARCAGAEARLNLSKSDKISEEAERLWMTITDVPSGCRSLFARLGETAPDEIYWQRPRLLVEWSKKEAFRLSLQVLPEEDLPDAKQITQLWDKPGVWLSSRKTAQTKTRAQREFVAFALARQAAFDAREAARLLESWQETLGKTLAAWAWGEIALSGARRHLPEAETWFDRSAARQLSLDAREWRVRAALRQKNWFALRRAIEDLPEEARNDPAWIYWLGRSYKEEGALNEARDIFWRLRGQTNFYGNLADEELEREIRFPLPAAAPVSAEEYRAARAHPGLRRALALFRLDCRLDAVREWNWSIQGMTDRQLLAAAKLAQEERIYDRAINTAERTREQHDYALRFLAPYDKQVRLAAREQALDDAWVYGLMRQESRFVVQAKSSVGASGLMQIMPATARWVARKIGLKDYDPKRVTDTETNLLLGTSYMRMVLESLQRHPVLASAAYNAGPGRARRWCADAPLEGAIYVETIPFNETRDYVKKVLSNSVYYTLIFTGKPASLRERLGTIPARERFVPEELP